MHHATIVFGKLTVELESELPADLTIHQTFSSFGIEHSRGLKEIQTRTLATGELRHVVIEVGAITLEAQHALLKTLEEPTPGYRFIFVVPETVELLPTLLSRCEIVFGETDSDLGPARAWLAANAEKRIQTVHDLVETAPDPAAARQTALDLIIALATLIRGSRSKLEMRIYEQALVQTQRAARFLLQRSGLPRLILEHLALVLPKL